MSAGKVRRHQVRVCICTDARTTGTAKLFSLAVTDNKVLAAAGHLQVTHIIMLTYHLYSREFASTAPSRKKIHPVYHLQFPVWPAFAMTINKSQGRTFLKVGVYLPVPCFWHGQLYVAMSRIGSPTGTHMLITHPQPKGAEAAYTDNVVHKEVLRS
eukprot:364639-Chlamydomonas_euryale.AAC.33